MKSQPSRIQSIGLVAMGVLYLASVVQLSQLSSAPANFAGEPCGRNAKTVCAQPPPGVRDRVDLWRGVAMASVYLGFCLRPRRCAKDENDYIIENLR